MAHFVLPRFPKVYRDYHGETINNPVNIDFCTELCSKDEPNGYGKKYPVIIFKGCDAKWYFTKQETRDSEFNRIINLVNNGNNIHKQA